MQDSVAPSKVVERAIPVMLQQVEEAVKLMRFYPLLEGVRQVFEDCGVQVDRIQMPMSKPAGFRHPIYWAIIVTWTRDSGFADTFLVRHDERERMRRAQSIPHQRPPEESPYSAIFGDPEGALRVKLQEDVLTFPILEKFRDAGLVDYLTFNIPVPGLLSNQSISLAAQQPFPDHIEALIQKLRGVFSLSFLAVYRTSQAIQVSRAYLGHQTGDRVLDGDIVRGQTLTIESGVMFCDVRGFTTLSEQLGALEMVPLMNEIFAIIGDAASERGGEILKFIGDAMLLIFRLEDRPHAQIAQEMVETVKASQQGLARLAAERSLTLGVGFGGHIGSVVYGNIGTPSRLDFTVMGPAVNLTSRLESLTKTLDTDAAFSSSIAVHIPELVPAGRHRVKGIQAPVDVHLLPSSPA